ncbi:MAG: DUF4942 domain-containing protein, partial [Planctomycetota bacterium]
PFDLAPPDEVTRLLNARDDVRAALGVVREASEAADATMRDALGEHVATYNRRLEIEVKPPVGSSSVRVSGNYPDKADALERLADRPFWLALSRLMCTRDLMSERDAEKLDEQMHGRHYSAEEKLPPFTRANVEASVRKMRDDVPGMIDDLAVAAFRGCAWDRKTNSPTELGPRCIITYATPSHWSPGNKLHRASQLLDLERALVLEGGALPGSIGGGIRECEPSDWGEWTPVRYGDGRERLRVKLHKNGNAHVDILDDEARARLNARIFRLHPNAIGATK